MRKDIKERKEEIIRWIKDCKPKALICKELKCKAETLDGYLKQFGISYKGNQGAKGYKVSSSRISAKDYLQKDIVVISKLRKKLIQDGLKEEKCESCKLSLWLNVKIPLELHHLDGNRFNNNIENLQILCPNCHALTENYGSKNKQMPL